MVTAEDSSHKYVAPFRKRRFHFFNKFCEIYGKGHATVKDAQLATNIVEEIQNEGNDGSPNVGSAIEYHTQHLGDDIEMSFALLMSNSSKKRKANEMREANIVEVVMRATILLTDKMVKLREKLSESIGTEMRLEKKS
ncbi:hypothetical protein PTKIN_Ptkin06aG0141300 [Pterospermum kingtungense]